MRVEVGVRTTPVYTLISERVGSVADSQALNHNQASLSSFIFNQFSHMAVTLVVCLRGSGKFQARFGWDVMRRQRL